MAEFGRRLQTGVLDRSAIRGETYCLADDPAVGFSVWEAPDLDVFEAAFAAWRPFYSEDRGAPAHHAGRGDAAARVASPLGGDPASRKPSAVAAKPRCSDRQSQLRKRRLCRKLGCLDDQLASRAAASEEPNEFRIRVQVRGLISLRGARFRHAPRHSVSRPREHTESRGSAIRSLLKVTQQPGVISLGGGMPSPASFPIDAIRAAYDAELAANGPAAVQYSTTA